ncbi:hypothetical protein GOP47_0000067 [Adiantum capillus-veneris]|uniref:Uncharacterized protein n=1 Tax=Adiantum capillus-veneris TaxID=13818 RepID=A0A9D4VE80_ADICA|nr:hypothetical protein GOP47_0000067 [Adiantum capillus-veneris]
MESRQRKERKRQRNILFDMDMKQEGQRFDVNANSIDKEIHANNEIIDDTIPSISEYGEDVRMSCKVGLQDLWPHAFGEKELTKTRGNTNGCGFDHDVHHTKVVAKQVLSPPERPTTWLVESGTGVSKEEYAGLLGAGFVVRSPSPKAVKEMETVGTFGKRNKKWRSVRRCL